MSLSKQILLALATAVANGLFFGEKVGSLDIAGRAFVQALQVTVPPFVAGSLIAGFGSMRREGARLMASRGGLPLLVLWCAWSLLHPEFAPVATEPRPGVTSLAYVLPRDEPELRRVVDTRIGVTRGYERFASARRYWILGQAARQKKPRWSIARDLLGWWKD